MKRSELYQRKFEKEREENSKLKIDLKKLNSEQKKTVKKLDTSIEKNKKLEEEVKDIKSTINKLLKKSKLTRPKTLGREEERKRLRKILLVFFILILLSLNVYSGIFFNYLIYKKIFFVSIIIFVLSFIGLYAIKKDIKSWGILWLILAVFLLTSLVSANMNVPQSWMFTSFYFGPNTYVNLENREPRITEFITIFPIDKDPVIQIEMKAKKLNLSELIEIDLSPPKEAYRVDYRILNEPRYTTSISMKEKLIHEQNNIKVSNREKIKLFENVSEELQTSWNYYIELSIYLNKSVKPNGRFAYEVAKEWSVFPLKYDASQIYFNKNEYAIDYEITPMEEYRLLKDVTYEKMKLIGLIRNSKSKERNTDLNYIYVRTYKNKYKILKELLWWIGIGLSVYFVEVTIEGIPQDE